MNPNNVWKKNREFYIGVAGTVLEGLFSGSLFMLLYSVMRFLWDGQFDMNRVLVLTGVIAFIFLLRILIYSYGYTKAQIGGFEGPFQSRRFFAFTQTNDDLQGHGSRLEVNLPCLFCFFKAPMIYIN